MPLTAFPAYSQPCDRPSEEIEDGLELDPGGFGRTEDSVRLYLREMATVPLLTREGEVALARQIESGDRVVRKMLSRSPLVAQLLLETRSSIAAGALSIREVLLHSEEIEEALFLAEGEEQD